MIPDEDQHAFYAEVNITPGEERVAKRYRTEDLNYIRKKLNASRNYNSHYLGPCGNRCYEAARSLIESLEFIYQLEDPEQFLFIPCTTVLSLPDKESYVCSQLTTRGYVAMQSSTGRTTRIPYSVEITFDLKADNPDGDVYSFVFKFYDRNSTDYCNEVCSGHSVYIGAIPAPSTIGMIFMRAFNNYRSGD